jgi:hypothetical protein
MELVYLNARYYDPEIGRFVSPDPLAQLGQKLNRYTYSRNNPINFLDPTGLQDCPIVDGVPRCGEFVTVNGKKPAADVRGAPSWWWRWTIGIHNRGPMGVSAEERPVGQNRGPEAMREKKEAYEARKATKEAETEVDVQTTTGSTGGDGNNGNNDGNGQEQGCPAMGCPEVNNLPALVWEDTKTRAIGYGVPHASAILVTPGVTVLGLPSATSNGTLGSDLVGQSWHTLKINRAGQLQPAHPSTQQYMNWGTKVGFAASPVGRFMYGAAQGYADAKSAKMMPTVTPVGWAGTLGYSAGRTLGMWF